VGRKEHPIDRGIESLFSGWDTRGEARISSGPPFKCFNGKEKKQASPSTIRKGKESFKAAQDIGQVEKNKRGNVKGVRVANTSLGKG